MEHSINNPVTQADSLHNVQQPEVLTGQVNSQARTVDDVGLFALSDIHGLKGKQKCGLTRTTTCAVTSAQSLHKRPAPCYSAKRAGQASLMSPALTPDMV